MNDLSFAFVIFFVTLGPIKVIPAYAQLTRDFTPGDKHKLALKAALIATIVGLAIIFLGDRLRQNWGIETPDLLVTGGLLLLIDALESIKQAQHPHQHLPADPPKSPEGLAMSPVAFPIIITPWGIAALLLFAAVAADTQTFLTGVFALFLGMMVADYLAMIFAAPILKFIRPGTLMAFGWLVSVLQAALAVHAILDGLRRGGPIDFIA